MADNNQPFSPEVLLRRAAAGDAARAVELLETVSSARLLDAVVTQAELATDDDRRRRAGIDAIAELDRAAIEVMDLPQSSRLAVDAAVDTHRRKSHAATATMLVGWELVTVHPDDLDTATVTIDARPWQLALVAFADTIDNHGVCFRRVVSAAADGRLLAAQLRFTADIASADLLDAVVSHRHRDLTDDAALAAGLLAALRAAARGS
ncbi:MAG: hypothetical protein WD576_02205 [Nitriliruptoraceae bacterium]